MPFIYVFMYINLYSATLQHEGSEMKNIDPEVSADV